MKVTITKAGLVIPREMAERLGSDEVEVFEEPGRLLIVAEPASVRDAGPPPNADRGEDPLLGLGRRPVRTGVRDGSTGHDRYLYGTDE